MTDTAFIRTQAPALLDTLTPDTPRRWGKMSPQHMVEHVSYLFYVSRSELGLSCVTPPDKMEKALEFLWSDRQFRENTRAPGMPEEPLPLRFASLDEARLKLRENIGKFYELFGANAGVTTMHPVFGRLDLAGWEQFHHKHLQHHLRQFGLID
ncbi:MAG: DUF1569 domain-containing protein [Bacteroidia bacterium]|nr:DUF1569 domain-containing protein [Bacteroidia bacterium]